MIVTTLLTNSLSIKTTYTYKLSLGIIQLSSYATFNWVPYKFVGGSSSSKSKSANAIFLIAVIRNTKVHSFSWSTISHKEIGLNRWAKSFFALNKIKWHNGCIVFVYIVVASLSDVIRLWEVKSHRVVSHVISMPLIS